MSDINSVILYVADIQRSKTFYADILGRDAVQSSARFAMFPAGPALMLGLWRSDEVQPKAGGPGGGEICFTVSSDAEVDSASATWKAKGVRLAQAPTRMDFGYTFVGLDPDGHRIRVFAPAV